MPLHTPVELTADTWRRAGRALLAKAIAELCHEELLEPVEQGDGEYRIDLDGGVAYRFTGRRGAYESWFVDPGSVRRDAPGSEPGAEADDPAQFFIDARQALGLAGDTAGHLIRELNATLAADAKLLSVGGLAAAELAELPYERLEGYQTGHPAIVLNKGRMGFSSSDAQLYAPEARRPMALPWIAVHRDLAEFRAVPGLDADQLYAAELDEDTVAAFQAVLRHRRLDLSAYYWLPIHPWQWDETVLPLVAPYVADRRIVPLGTGPDAYLPQQSIRTFTNVSEPERYHVKLPLSVLNTLTWRGLPTERTLAAPAVTAWMKGITRADPNLVDECRVALLGEVASVGVAHPGLDALPGIPYQYREMLGAVWREPLAGALEPGERGRPLAALLHVDPAGRTLLAELVARSGLEPRAWLGHLFSATLPPLLHYLYNYGTVFCPHGENAIVVFDEQDVPARLAIKDFVDDLAISSKALPELADVPPELAEILPREAPDYLCEYLHATLFAGHFRYLADLAERELGVPDREFWPMVRAEILAYQDAFPGLAERFAIFDLLTARVERLCLNRNRLQLDGYRDRPDRPLPAVYGTVSNPLSESD
jgi:siderophore synthetase component